jgi:D-alanyl-D-alanine dipeptidase
MSSYNTIDNRFKLPAGVNGDYLKPYNHLENMEYNEVHSEEQKQAIQQAIEQTYKMLRTAHNENSYVHLRLADKMVTQLYNAGYDADDLTAMSNNLHVILDY